MLSLDCAISGNRLAFGQARTCQHMQGPRQAVVTIGFSMDTCVISITGKRRVWASVSYESRKAIHSESAA
jgi:hypothetical protein